MHGTHSSTQANTWKGCTFKLSTGQVRPHHPLRPPHTAPTEGVTFHSIPVTVRKHEDRLKNSCDCHLFVKPTSCRCTGVSRAAERNAGNKEDEKEGSHSSAHAFTGRCSEETQKGASHDSFFFFLPTVAFWKIVETSSLRERQRGAFAAALKGTEGVPAMTSHYIRMLIIKTQRQ